MPVEVLPAVLLCECLCLASSLSCFQASKLQRCCFRQGPTLSLPHLVCGLQATQAMQEHNRFSCRHPQQHHLLNTSFPEHGVAHKPARLRCGARVGAGAQKARNNAEWSTLFDALWEEGSDADAPDNNSNNSTRKDRDKMELYLPIANPIGNLSARQENTRGQVTLSQQEHAGASLTLMRDPVCMWRLLERRCVEAKHWKEKVVEVEMEWKERREALGWELDVMQRQLESAETCCACSNLLSKAETLILQSILNLAPPDAPRGRNYACTNLFETMPVQISEELL
ncbi:hypothetical protein B0H17DRAFT_1124788 [Mycena rosella]|uniref:Uncharacterized protein n=1 Tax=Mycena rosella TaxID=1033263 RepID=A0AAD7GZX7_MYCRO|nr:hypothetical protein B0H17DRAFT_1124788 [Mycena rosella]